MSTYKNVSSIFVVFYPSSAKYLNVVFGIAHYFFISDIDLHAQAGENGVKAAKQRKSRMKKLDKLGVMSAGEGRKFKASYDGQAEEIEAYEEDEEVVLNFPDPGGFDNASIVTLERVSFGYTPEKRLLDNAELTIDLQSRVGLLGRNGCGKSTLIKLIVGAIQPNKGKVSINGRAKIEYLAQHQLEQLDPDSNPMEHMLERYPGDRSNATKMELRRYLANYGLGGDELPLQKISTMSGGQKCRLCMAAALYRKPHLLILDEREFHFFIICFLCLDQYLPSNFIFINSSYKPFGSGNDRSFD